MLSIRGGSGLGDAIYVQAVARHLIDEGHRVEACSDWPDVFRPLGAACRVSPFRRERIDRLCHYSLRRGVAGTTQFEDCCIQAGLKPPFALRLDWRPAPIERLLGRRVGDDRPVVVVPMPRAPFARADGFGIEFLPDCRVLDRAIELLAGRAFVVQVGSGEPLYRLRGIDCDLAGRTSVSELFDVAWAASAFLGFCSFVVPMAEARRLPALLVWSRRGLASRHLVVRQMTPRKVLHGPASRFVMDDCTQDELGLAVDALLADARTPAVL